MKKLLVIMIFVLLLSSCEIGLMKLNMPDSGKNPFSDPCRIYQDEPEAIGNGGVIRFIALSDAHFDRRGEDSGVSYNNGNFYSFLQDYAERIDFFAFTGDMLDTFNERNIEAYRDFIDGIKNASKNNANINAKGIYVLGNHDFVDSDYQAWLEEFKDEDFFLSHSSMASYGIGDVAVYKLDSCYRVFGGVQLRYLEEAIAASPAKYNIILNHVPLGADTIDQTKFQFVIADANERNMLLKTLSSHKPSFILSGHHHKGNILNSWSSSVQEMILAAYHRRDILLDLESKGYWYVVELDQDTGKVDISGYRIDDPGTVEKSYSFCLQ